MTKTIISQKKGALQSVVSNIKTFIGITLIAIFSLFILSFKTSEKAVTDVWKQLGLTQQQGSEKIKNAFLYGYIENSIYKNVRHLASGNKAAIARDLMAYTKTYLNGAAFKAAYAKERAASKPETLSLVPVSKEGIRKERIAELRKNIREAEESVKKMPALEKSAQKTIAGYEKAIKDYESPDSKMLNTFYETAVSQQQNKQQQYDKKMKAWQEDYPENPKEKVKKYLEKYLAIAPTVDFDAELTQKNNLKVFANPAYESKNHDWKRIYRGGKDVYNAMKPLAEQWLKELQ